MRRVPATCPQLGAGRGRGYPRRLVRPSRVVGGKVELGRRRAGQDDVVNKAGITPEVARRAVAAQFPQWAGLPVRRVPRDGWDNTTFRLGDDLSIRMPSQDAYVAQIAKEHRWLPLLRESLPLQIPEPVAIGEPSDDFPLPWSVYRWIDGEPASTARITDPARFATDLARFLAALYTIDAGSGPVAGEHNFFRGAPLDVYDDQTRQAINALAGRIDHAAAAALWDDALQSRWERDPVWIHGDVAASNLIVRDGELRAVIDFGCAAVGDPACDLVIAWTFLDHHDRLAFRQLLNLDEATWTRGKAWALWKALITLADAHATDHAPVDAMEQYGWRHDPTDLVTVLLNSEH